MLEAQFKELVDELEEGAREGDGGYRLKVALLAALGYLYVVVVVALLAGAVWLLALAMKDGRNLALLKIAIPMAILAVVGLRSLWVRLDPPEGLPVTPLEAPQLFKLIGRVRKRLKGPPIHHVLMTAEYNAAIVQLPRYGLLGGGRNYLIVGLPLIQTLTVEQFAAVLAHEYGHLSGAHGHFASWIYRVRMTWARILDALAEHPTWGSGVFLYFFRWYVPYFSAYTFVLARSNEYEADRASADVVGARVTADALAQVELGAQFMHEQFWPTFVAAADKVPVPAFLPYAQLPLSLQVGLASEDAQAWLKAALLTKTDVADTHPSLKDRIGALEQPARLPERSGPNAAKALLDKHLPAVVKHFDKDWAKANLRDWSERHKDGQALKARAGEISAKAKSGLALNATEWHDFARACERFSSEEKAEAYYRRALDVAPEHHESHLAVGTLLLKRRDAAGIAHLDKAIPAGGETAYAASLMAARYFREAGREKDAERYELKLMAQEAQEHEQVVNQVYLAPDDSYGPHGLSDKELGLCRAAFKRCAHAQAVLAVRKFMPGGAEPYLVFVVEPKVTVVAALVDVAIRLVGIHPKEDMSSADEVLQKVKLDRPFSVFVDMYLPDEAVAKVKEVEGARIFGPEDR